MSEDFKVQVSVKYGQTLFNFRGNTIEEVRGYLVEFVGDPDFTVSDDGSPKSLGDLATDLTEVFHKGERTAGIFEERTYNRGGGGGGAPRGGSAPAPRPGVPDDKVTYWVDRTRVQGVGDLPFAQGSQGPDCPACGAPTSMQWTNASTKEGPNHGKRWAVWQCSQSKSKGHGEFYKA